MIWVNNSRRWFTATIHTKSQWINDRFPWKWSIHVSMYRFCERHNFVSFKIRSSQMIYSEKMLFLVESHPCSSLVYSFGRMSIFFCRSQNIHEIILQSQCALANMIVTSAISYICSNKKNCCQAVGLLVRNTQWKNLMSKDGFSKADVDDSYRSIK